MPERDDRHAPGQTTRRSFIWAIFGVIAAFFAFTSNATSTLKNTIDFLSGKTPSVRYGSGGEGQSPDRQQRPAPTDTPANDRQPISFGSMSMPAPPVSTASGDVPPLGMVHAFYRFGDQVLRADFEGKRVSLYYAVPNERMRKLHAQGQIYGVLTINGDVVSGWAQGRAEKCDPIQFHVYGTTSEDRASISFDGNFPLIDGDTCRIVDHLSAHAVLSRI